MAIGNKINYIINGILLSFFSSRPVFVLNFLILEFLYYKVMYKAMYILPLALQTIIFNVINTSYI